MNRPFACTALVVAVALSACSSEDEASSPGAGATTSGGGQGGLAAGGGGPTGDLTGVVQKLRYRFDLETAQASSELTVQADPPGGDCYQVDSALLPETLEWNGAPAAPTWESGSLRACGASVHGGESLRLGASLSVPEQTFFGLDVGLSRQPSSAGSTFTYLLSWVGGCDLFGPCDDDPALLTAFELEIVHPTKTVALCPGAIEHGDTVTRCIIDGAGTLAPTYSAFAFAADPSWQRQEWLTAAGVTLAFYEVPGGALAASLDTGRVQAFLEWITGLLGPYPYGSELRVAGGPTAWLGFEHPANIVLREDLPDTQTSYDDATMHVLMHEIVHQWAGDRTTLATAQDFVWKEAIAEYLSYVFEDEQGLPGEADATRAYWEAVSLQAEYHPRPTDEPPPAVHVFYGDVYGPGPMTLFVQLEALLGRRAVLDAIAAFLSTASARTVEELRGELEVASGENLETYFDAWVFGSGAPQWPSFSVDTTQLGDRVTVTLTQTTGAPHPCRVEVRVEGATSSAIVLVDFGLEPSSPVASATAMLAEPVMAVLVDPDHRVIDAPRAAVATRLPVWIF